MRPIEGLVRRIRNATSALGYAVRHPRSAIHTLNEKAAGLPEQPGRRFGAAMHQLTGLDVSLEFERAGISWLAPPGSDGIIHEMFETGGFQTSEIRAVLDFTREHRPGRRWMIDVGANIGTTTVPFARAGYHVVAIEPVPDAVRYLRHNVRVNGLDDKVRIVEAAIASGQPEVYMAVSTSLGNSAMVETPSATPNFDGLYERAGTLVVQGLELDNIVRSSGVAARDVALVWSDTQASETHVISTGASLWAAGVPLWAELWPDGLDMGAGFDDFLERASQHFTGFVPRDEILEGRLELRPITKLRDVADAIDEPRGYTDVLLLP